MSARAVSLAALVVVALSLAAGAVGVAHIPGYAIAAPTAGGLLPPTPSAQTVTIDVKQGDSADMIARRLRDAGVIRNADLFTELTALEGLQDSLAAGEYHFNRNLPAAEVLSRMHGADTGAIRVTIPEGKRVEEVGQILEKAGVVPAQGFLAAVANGSYSYNFLKDKPAGAGLEGYLFPDTYDFPAQNKPEEVVNLMLNDFDKRLASDLRQAYAQEGLTIHQAVTLASIVEREAQLPGERPVIASVFFNRMKLGMPLQADPTVQFALSQDPKSLEQFGLWKAPLTDDDLRVRSSYNTYVNAGLPPGPIANPGLATLQAVAHPAQTSDVYFVAKGDGSHAFAATYEEQLANIAKYQQP